MPGSLVCLLLYLSVQSFNSALEKNKIAYQIVTSSFERRVIIDEYILHKLDRSKQQWKSVNNDLSTYLQSKISNFSQHKEKLLIDDLIKKTDENAKTFLELIVITEESQKSSEAADVIKESQRTRLISQLLIKSQDIILITTELAAISYGDALMAQKNIIFLFLGFIISLISIVTTVVLFLWKNVVVPIAKLDEGTKIIANGNLNYEVDIESRNEIGELATSFNEMTHKLKTSMGKTAEELQKFRLAFDNAADHIVITTPEGIILYANKGAENTTGYSQEEMVGKKPSLWGSLMPKDFYATMWKTIKEKRKEFTGEITNKRKNGKTYQAELKIAPVFDDAGKIKLFVGIERDITKEKEIDKAKTEFVLLASHQLRTPLSTINWYAQMLLAGDAGKLKKKQEKYLDKVHSTSQDMVKLVNTLLNISQFELGMFMVNAKPVNILELLLSAIDEQKRAMDHKKLTFIRKFSTNIPTILADPKFLSMVFQNLLSNAVKYTPEEGIIKCSISLRRRKDILVKLADTGYGIPKNQQEKIFTKLFRADNAREKDTTGAGLGLYIVKSIIEHSGGKIWFKSEENKGTTFFFTLPTTSPHKK